MRLRTYSLVWSILFHHQMQMMSYVACDVPVVAMPVAMGFIPIVSPGFAVSLCLSENPMENEGSPVRY